MQRIILLLLLGQSISTHAVSSSYKWLLPVAIGTMVVTHVVTRWSMRKQGAGILEKHKEEYQATKMRLTAAYETALQKVGLEYDAQLAKINQELKKAEEENKNLHEAGNPFNKFTKPLTLIAPNEAVGKENLFKSLAIAGVQYNFSSPESGYNIIVSLIPPNVVVPPPTVVPKIRDIKPVPVPVIQQNPPNKKSDKKIIGWPWGRK